MIISSYATLCQSDATLRSYQQKAKREIFDTWDEKAKAIDQKIFDLYGLTPEEREAIGYIDIK